MPNERRRILKYSAYLSACAPEALAYGNCVSGQAETIKKGACSKEFELLAECVRKQQAKAKYNFDLSPPYRIIMDGTYAKAALAEQLNLAEQLPKYLGSSVELMTTNCCLAELEKLGSPVYGALHICRQQQVAECPHRPAKGAAQCLAHLARRSLKKGGAKYIFATQDPTLTDKLREMGGIPILYIAYKTVLLDPVSEATKEKMVKPATDVEEIIQLKKEILGEELKKKKQKKKGVNPLSCKKKIVKEQKKAVEGTKTVNGKRRRKKKAKGEGMEGNGRGAEGGSE